MVKRFLKENMGCVPKGAIGCVVSPKGLMNEGGEKI